MDDFFSIDMKGQCEAWGMNDSCLTVIIKMSSCLKRIHHLSKASYNVF